VKRSRSLQRVYCCRLAPTHSSQESNDAVALPAPPSLPVVYRVYDTEQTAARAAQLLVEAGFRRSTSLWGGTGKAAEARLHRLGDQTGHRGELGGSRQLHGRNVAGDEAAFRLVSRAFVYILPRALEADVTRIVACCGIPD
jgi:hypothetical protein